MRFEPCELRLDPLELIPKWAFWEDACRAFATNVKEAMRLAGMPRTRRNVIQFVDSLPTCHRDFMSEVWQEGVCNKCLARVNDVEDEVDLAKQLLQYFIFYLPSRPAHAQQMLVEALKGTLGIITLESEKEATDAPKQD